MSVIAGATMAHNINQAQLVISMEAESAKLDPNSHLFEHVSREISKKKSGNGGIVRATRSEHHFRERRIIALTTTVGANEPIGETSIAVADASIFHRDQYVYCPQTGEIFAVDEDVGGTAVPGSVKVRRKTTASGTGIAVGLTSGDVLINLGESHAEGAAIPPAFGITEDDVSTYIMQIDRVRQSTDILNEEEQYGTPEITLARRDKWIEVMREINALLYVGQNLRETASSGTGARRHMLRGLDEYLNATQYDASVLVGGLTLPALASILRPTMVHNATSMTKCAILGQNAWLDVSAWGDSAVRIAPGSEQKWGVTFKMLHTAFGDLEVGYDQFLSAEHGLEGRGYILDTRNIYQVQLGNLELRYYLNVQNNSDIHNTIDVISGTRGLVLKLPEVHRQFVDLPA